MRTDYNELVKADDIPESEEMHAGRILELEQRMRELTDNREIDAADLCRIAKEIGITEDELSFAKHLLTIKGFDIIERQEIQETDTFEKEPDNLELKKVEEELECDEHSLEELMKDSSIDSEQETSKEAVPKDLFKQYLKEINKIPLLTDEETALLATKIKSGDETAKKKLVESNLRLVIKPAIKYMYDRYELLMDLVQEGNQGLIKAAEKFDPTRGFKFSTYAYWWIKKYIRKASGSQDRTISVPDWMDESIKSLKNTVKQLTAEMGRTPQDTEIAKEMGIPLNKVRELILYSNIPVSLNMPIGEDEESELQEMIPDNSGSQSEAAERADLLKGMSKIMSEVLSINQINVFTLRFGLPFSIKENKENQRIVVEINTDENGDPQYIKPMTIKTVGEKLGLSEYQVKTNENKAITKMNIALTKGGFIDY